MMRRIGRLAGLLLAAILVLSPWELRGPTPGAYESHSVGLFAPHGASAAEQPSADEGEPHDVMSDADAFFGEPQASFSRRGTSSSQPQSRAARPDVKSVKSAYQDDAVAQGQPSLEDRFNQLKETLPDDEPTSSSLSEESIRVAPPRMSGNVESSDFAERLARRTRSRAEPAEPSANRITRRTIPASTPQSAEATSAVDPSSADASDGGVTVRWIVPTEMSLGQETTCQLIVSNAGDLPATDVQIHIELPEGLQLVRAVPELSGQGIARSYMLGELSPKQVATMSMSVVPTERGLLRPKAVATFVRAATASIDVLEPQLRLEIEGPGQAMLGEAANYHLTVTNPGTGAAVNVSVSVTLDPQLRHPRGANVEFAIGTLGAGQSRAIQLPLTGLSPGPLALSGAASAGGGLTAKVDYQVDIVCPQLQLALAGPKLRYVDRRATYIATIHNPGPAPADNIKLVGLVPEGFQFVEATPGGTFDPEQRQVGWFVGHLAPNETTQVGVQLIPTLPGEHRLAAEIHGDAGVSAHAELNTHVEGSAVITLDVTESDDPAEIGTETTYEIRVTNRGSQPERRVQVAARLSEEIVPIDASGVTAGTIDQDQIVFAPIPELAPGQSELYRISVECRSPGRARLRAYYRSDGTPTPVAEDEVTRIYED